MVENNVSINYLKSISKWSTAVSFKKTPKSVSDTGNPYHVASLLNVDTNGISLCGLFLKGKQRQRFGDMGLIELRKTNNFQPQSHF